MSNDTNTSSGTTYEAQRCPSCRNKELVEGGAGTCTRCHDNETQCASFKICNQCSQENNLCVHDGSPLPTECPGLDPSWPGNPKGSPKNSSKKPTGKRGFGSMDPEKQKLIASQGGKAAHAKGKAHEYTADEARAAGRKGGIAVSRNREHMAAIGKEGGRSRGRNMKRRKQQQASTPDDSNS